MYPEISVVMSVYNGEKHLVEAIESILNQSFKNFEFIIINDGSMDGSLEIIKKYEIQDKRIKFIDNGKNKGLIYSLNLGLSVARGKYVARMDADDISFSKRLEIQKKYLDENIEVGICASRFRFFRHSFFNFGKISGKKMKTDEIKVELLFRNCIVHPSVMFRKEVLDKNELRYDSNDRRMEDYGLWLKMSKMTEIHIIDDILLNFRVTSDSVTTESLRKREEYFKIRKILLKRELKEVFYLLSEEELEDVINTLLKKEVENNIENVKKDIAVFEKIYNTNLETKSFDSNILKNKILENLEKKLIARNFKPQNDIYFFQDRIDIKNFKFKRMKYLMVKKIQSILKGV